MVVATYSTTTPGRALPSQHGLRLSTTLLTKYQQNTSVYDDTGGLCFGGNSNDFRVGGSPRFCHSRFLGAISWVATSWSVEECFTVPFAANCALFIPCPILLARVLGKNGFLSSGVPITHLAFVLPGLCFRRYLKSGILEPAIAMAQVVSTRVNLHFRLGDTHISPLRFVLMAYGCT